MLRNTKDKDTNKLEKKSIASTKQMLPSVDGESVAVPSTIKAKPKRTGLVQVTTSDDSADAAPPDDANLKQAPPKSVVSNASGSISGRKALKNPNFEAEKPITDWSSIEFLEAKNALKMRSAIQRGRVEGKHSMTTLLSKTKAMSDAKTCDLSDVPKNIEDVIATLKANCATACDLDDRVMKATKSSYKTLKDEVRAVEETLDEIAVDYEEVSAAVRFKVKQTTKETAGRFSKNYW